MTTIFKKPIYCLAALATTMPWLGGCASVEGLRPDIAARPVPSRLDEIAYINTLRSAYVEVSPQSLGKIDGMPLEQYCFDGKGLQPFRSKSGQGYADTENNEDRFQPSFDETENRSCITFRQPSSKDETRNYLAAGFGLTDIYCQRFFTVVNASEQNRKFGRSVASGVDAMVGSILSLSGAGETATGIVNAGFGALDNTFEAYDASYLVAPDMSNVRKLVLAAQDQYRQKALNTDSGEFAQNFPAARSIIERYAGVCTFSGMRELVNQSIKDKTDSVNTNTAEGGEVKTDGAGKPVAPVKGDDKSIPDKQLLAVPVPVG